MKLSFSKSTLLVVILFFVSYSLDAQVPDRFERKSKDEKQEQEVPQDKPEKAEEVQEAEETSPNRGEPINVKRSNGSTSTKSSTPPPKKTGFNPENLRYGGALGMTFGDFTYVLLNPRVGYYFTEKLFGGVGFTYIYSRDNRASTVFYNNGNSLEQSIYGINPFVNYEVFAGVGVGAEFDLVNADILRLNPFTGEINVQRDWVPHLFLGATYYPKDQGGFLGIYWNVLDDGNSFYANPEIRFGFLF